MRTISLFVLAAMFSSCVSPARRPAEDDDKSPQGLKIKEMAEQIKKAELPGFDSFKSLNMKFNFEQTWKIATLGSDRPDYNVNNLPSYETGTIQIFDGTLHTAATRALVDRTPVSDADFRHILHPNGICLRGTWKMDKYAKPFYTGQFQPGTVANIIVRASSFGSNVMVNSGDYNSFGFVGRIFLQDTSESADFITQTDLGGVEANSFFESDTLNAPPVSALKRKNSIFDIEVTKFAGTGKVFDKVDSNNSNRQVYTIAELGKGSEPTHTPPFMKFAFSKMSVAPPKGPMDFRNEILHHVPFTVEVQVSEAPGEDSILFGKKIPPNSPTWRRIGEVTIDSAIASFACDFRLNIRHSPWRDDVNKPGTERKDLQHH